MWGSSFPTPAFTPFPAQPQALRDPAWGPGGVWHGLPSRTSEGGALPQADCSHIPLRPHGTFTFVELPTLEAGRFYIKSEFPTSLKLLKERASV